MDAANLAPVGGTDVFECVFATSLHAAFSFSRREEKISAFTTKATSKLFGQGLALSTSCLKDCDTKSEEFDLISKVSVPFINTSVRNGPLDWESSSKGGGKMRG